MKGWKKQKQEGEKTKEVTMERVKTKEGTNNRFFYKGSYEWKVKKKKLRMKE